MLIENIHNVILLYKVREGFVRCKRNKYKIINISIIVITFRSILYYKSFVGPDGMGTVFICDVPPQSVSGQTQHSIDRRPKHW